MNNENPNKRNKIRQENEELKKKLEEDFGASKTWTNPDLPPDMENEFLKHIMEFENAWKDTKQISLYEYLGKPAYRSIHELQPDEISTELTRIQALMSENQISLDTICEVSDYELYRFITEELFTMEIDDKRIPGMMSCYIYEEFHPNHEYDINRYTHEFIKLYLDKNSDFYLHELSSDAMNQGWHKHFREAFNRFEILTFKIDNLNFNLETEKALVDFECDIQAEVEGSSDLFRFTGKGKIGFVYQWDYWYVESVEFPKPSNKLSSITS